MCSARYKTVGIGIARTSSVLCSHVRISLAARKSSTHRVSTHVIQSSASVLAVPKRMLSYIQVVRDMST